MDERIQKYLADIDSPITEIESYFQNIPKDFSVYRQNIML